MDRGRRRVALITLLTYRAGETVELAGFANYLPNNSKNGRTVIRGRERPRERERLFTLDRSLLRCSGADDNCRFTSRADGSIKRRGVRRFPIWRRSGFRMGDRGRASEKYPKPYSIQIRVRRTFDRFPRRTHKRARVRAHNHFRLFAQPRARVLLSASVTI